MVVETDDGRFLVKLRGAAQGTPPLVAEVVVAALASVIGLRVPERAVVLLDSTTRVDDRDPEVTELLDASHGENLGFRFLDGARDLRLEQLDVIDDDTARRILWLDALVMNPDRTRKNPNVLLVKRDVWLIDHGACLAFQYDWRSVDEDAPSRDPGPGGTHLLIERAAPSGDLEAGLVRRLTRDVIAGALDQVPDSFLQATLAENPDFGDLARLRAAYVAFLWKRLRAHAAAE